MGKIRFYNIDNIKFMKEIPDKFYDLAIVDPPYGINVAKMAYTQEDNRPVKQKNGTILRVKKLKYKHGDWDKQPPSDEYFKELFRISKHQIIWGIKHRWINKNGKTIDRTNSIPESGYTLQRSLDGQMWQDVVDSNNRKVVSHVKKIFDFGV